jgi:nucleotide-binding universal stress UspA family protein
MMLLICYDGSADAQAAIDHSALLMPGSEATVLVIWETLLETMTRSGSMGMGMGMVGIGDETGTDAAIRKGALNLATEGAQRAGAAGLVAQPRIANRDGDIAETIVTVAADLEADAIVLGTRGLGGLKSLMLGSVSHAVLHHADRAVLVVPSPGLAGRRHRWVDQAQIPVGSS